MDCTDHVFLEAKIQIWFDIVRNDHFCKRASSSALDLRGPPTHPRSIAAWRTRRRGSSGSSGVFRAASRPPVRPGRTSARDPQHTAIATDLVSQAVFFNPQGLTAREAAHIAVAIKWPRAVGIIETRGPKPNAVACPRGVAFCAASRRCQHVSIGTVAAVPLVPSRGRPRPYAPMERSSWRAAQATRRIFASWGVRHPGV